MSDVIVDSVKRSLAISSKDEASLLLQDVLQTEDQSSYAERMKKSLLENEENKKAACIQYCILALANSEL